MHTSWIFRRSLQLPTSRGGSEFGTSQGSLLRNLMWRQASCCLRTAQCQVNDVWCDLTMAQGLQTTRDVAEFQKGSMLTSLSIRRCICIKWQWHRHMLKEWQCLRFWTSHTLFRSDRWWVSANMIRLQHFEISGKVVQVPGKLLKKRTKYWQQGAAYPGQISSLYQKFCPQIQNYAVCSGHRVSLGWLDSCPVPRKQMETEAAECAVRMVYRIPMLSPHPRHTMDGTRIGNFSHRGPHWRTECLLDRFHTEVEMCPLKGCLTKPHGVISPALGADDVHLCLSQREAYSRPRLDIV